MSLSKEEFVEIINKSYDAVEASKFGKLLTGEKDPNGHLVYNPIALNVCMNILVATLNQTFKERDKK